MFKLDSDYSETKYVFETTSYRNLIKIFCVMHTFLIGYDLLSLPKI